MLRYSSLLILTALLVATTAEVVNFQPCTKSVDACTINEVRVDPCPEATQGAACKVKYNHSTQMSFDYTPHFEAATLENRLVWAKSETEELPLITLDHAGCSYTTCPVKSGVKQTYTIDVPIKPWFPVTPYTIRWTLTDPVSKKRCCFTTDIEVVRF